MRWPKTILRILPLVKIAVGAERKASRPMGAIGNLLFQVLHDWLRVPQIAAAYFRGFTIGYRFNTSGCEVGLVPEVVNAWWAGTLPKVCFGCWRIE